MSDTWEQHVADLERRRAAADAMGGDERVDRQHGAGKLTARERIDFLFDDGSFIEFGRLADHMDPSLGSRSLPADGVITGVGEIDGRRVALAAYDFTVKGGTMGNVGEMKVARIRETALTQRIPIVWLIDSAGARIEQSVGSVFAAAGHLFREQVAMSGVVPQVAAMLGPGAAGTAYIPGLADFVPMVRGKSSMALGGPALVKAAVGEDLSEEELGGADVHTKQSGVADLAVDDDVACLDAVARYLSYMPSHNQEPPPRHDSDDDATRSVPEVRDIVPTAPRRAYDVRKLIDAIVDRDSFFPMKPNWAKNLVTGFARFDGRVAGIVANQPIHMGGVLDVDAADKAARFVWLCDAFSIPLVFLVDTPGFLVGSSVERQGIIRHGAKMLFAVSEATVPKVTVVTRKAYGAGYFVMCGRAYESDYLVTWPTAEISVMGPDGAVNILFGRQIEAAPEEERGEMRLVMAEQIRMQIDPYIAAGWSAVDDVIAPEETRTAICRGLSLSRSKTKERPWRKHGVLPV